ncbi:MAG: 2-C-methyl-D-erythritol 2,4-cyclodiphosphate synthase [Clostridia bacterium]|nr:2-C-methyl-D-erythritol 2,4-cyclodiphosphate synthase [Clostridia bacterium]
MRIGIGCDTHRLTEGRKLILGGVEIEHTKGLLGHSDADALTHAVIDALLGAAGLGDIGTLFPDTDMKYKDISSLILLEEAGRRVKAAGYEIVNIDTIIIAQKPKMAPYKALMAETLAKTLGIDPSQINVKAKTNEHMGFTGREEGIETRAVALIN